MSQNLHTPSLNSGYNRGMIYKNKGGAIGLLIGAAAAPFAVIPVGEILLPGAPLLTSFIFPLAGVVTSTLIGGKLANDLGGETQHRDPSQPSVKAANPPTISASTKADEILPPPILSHNVHKHVQQR